MGPFQNNRHTAQSWRDRWVKYVSHYNRPESGDEAPPSPPHSPGPVTKRANQSAQRTTLRPKVPAEHTSISRRNAEPGVSAAAATRPYVAKSARGLHFTEEEKFLLKNSYDDIMNIDEDLVIDAWTTWAIEASISTHVSAQSLY